jgi:hypothetical protein
MGNNERLTKEERYKEEMKTVTECAQRIQKKQLKPNRKGNKDCKYENVG